MTHRSQTFGLDFLIARLDHVEQWLNSLGARANGRILQYRRHLEMRARGAVDNSSTSLDQFNAYFEACELEEIAKLPAELFDTQRKLKRLKSLAKGSDFYTDIRDDKARNYAFELATASFFHQLGFRVSLEDPADVVAKLGDSTVLIECKRPQFAASIASNIGEAFDWFDQNDVRPGMGLIALDVSRACNREFAYAEAKTVTEVREVVDNAIVDFSKWCQSKVSTARAKAKHVDRVVGILFRARMMAVATHDGREEFADNQIFNFFGSAPSWAQALA